MLRLFIISFLSLAFNATSQCNGAAELCTKRYNEVAYLTTHNAYNAGSNGFNLPNQNVGITQQLNDGVRGLMLDVYDQGGTPTVYHGSAILGSEPLHDNLIEIKGFLENNPTEVVTIILECYVSANMIETAINTAGLTPYLYTKTSTEWDFLGDMINTGERLVILTDVDDASASQQWYHYVWDHAVETHYSVNSIGEFTNDYNRGDENNDLFIFNHFVTTPVFGTGDQASATIVNTYSFLMDRIEQHYIEKVKFPNFITLDFYNVGEGLAVVDSLNIGDLTLAYDEYSLSSIGVYPNPASFAIQIKGQHPNQTQVQTKDLQGKLIQSTYGSVIDVSSLDQGIYLFEFIDRSGKRRSKKILIE